MEIPKAIVIYTDAETCVVICPYCLQYHRHGMPSGTTLNERRSSHCHKGEYDFGEVVHSLDMYKSLARRKKDCSRNHKKKVAIE